MSKGFGWYAARRARRARAQDSSVKEPSYYDRQTKENVMKNSATPPKAAPVDQLVVIGRLGGRQLTAPDLTARICAAKTAAELYREYPPIEDEDMKLFIHTELLKVKRVGNQAKQDLKTITDPISSAQRDLRSAKAAAENLFAPLLQYATTAEGILKNMLITYDQVKLRQRQLAEAEAQRQAQEEQARIQAEAQRQAEVAARKHQEEQAAVRALEEQGRQEEAEQRRRQAEEQLATAAEEVEHLKDAAEHTQPAPVIDDSIKVRGSAIKTTWKARVTNVREVFIGIAEGSTPMDAVRVRIDGRLQSVNGVSSKIEGIEINMPWFNDQARKMESNFSYRGMEAYADTSMSVTA